MAKKMQMRVNVCPEKITRFLSFIVVILVSLNLVAISLRFVFGHYSAYTFVEKFYLDEENNVPSYFSVAILICAAVLFGLIGYAKRRNRDPFYKHWTGLAFIFSYMSLDEGLQVHEAIMLPLKAFHFSGIFYFSWIIVGLSLLAIFLTVYLKFFFSLSNTYKIKFFIAGAIYVSGALGMELVGGFYASSHGQYNLTYALLTTVEETLEMVGIVYLIDCQLKYAMQYVEKLTFEFDKTAVEDESDATKNGNINVIPAFEKTASVIKFKTM